MLRHPVVAIAAVLVCAARPAYGQSEEETLRVEEAMLRMVRGAQRSGEVFLLSEPRLAAGMWFALAGRMPPGARPPSLHACAMPEGQRRPTCTVLATPGAARSDEPYTVDTADMEDTDNDGDPELRAVVKFVGAAPREGEGTQYERLFIVNVYPRTRLALAVETRRYTVASGRTIVREVSFGDEDGDGRNDAVVEESVCVETESGEGCDGPRRTIYLWRQRTDTWLLLRTRR